MNWFMLESQLRRFPLVKVPAMIYKLFHCIFHRFGVMGGRKTCLSDKLSFAKVLERLYCFLQLDAWWINTLVNVRPLQIIMCFVLHGSQRRFFRLRDDIGWRRKSRWVWNNWRDKIQRCCLICDRCQSQVVFHFVRTESKVLSDLWIKDYLTH